MKTRVTRNYELGFLDGIEVSEFVLESHKDEISRILASCSMTRRAARTLRRAGRFEQPVPDVYKDVKSGSLWVVDGDLVVRKEEAARKTASCNKTATWDTISSVLDRTEGWVPKFQISDDHDAVGIHLDSPLTSDDVVAAIDAASKQGHQVVHVH